MKLLLITFDFPPSIGGIQTRVKSYVENLVKMGHDVTLAHMIEPEEWRKSFAKYGSDIIMDNYRGATVIRTRYTVGNTFKIYVAILRQIGTRKPDIVHVFSGINLLIGNLFLLYGILRRCKIGVSLFGKDYLASRPNPLYFIPLLLSLSITQRIGVNSRATLELIPTSLRIKGRVLYPGVDVGDLSRALTTTTRHEGEPKILFVGRMVRRKGPDILIRAFGMLLKSHPKVKLVMVGDGPFIDYLKKLVNDLGLDGKVEFTGALKGAALYARYLDSDIFVMPSRQSAVDMEGFGMVFLEAGFFSKPCIGTRTGGIPEAILDGQTGLLVPQEDNKAVFYAMDHILNDSDYASRLGEAAHRRVVTNFTWAMATLRFLSMYDRSIVLVY